MSDLTDEEIADWCTGRPDNPTTRRGVYMALEIRRHRAAQAASRERVMEVVRSSALALLTERNLYIVKPQSPTIGEMALEAYGHGKACDAAALLGDELQAVLTTIASRVADPLATPADRKPSLAEQRAAHAMRTPSEEERRENIKSITSEVTARGLLTVEPTTPEALSAEERAVLQRMREHAAKHRDGWLGWPTEKMYADEVALIDRLLGAKP